MLVSSDRQNGVKFTPILFCFLYSLFFLGYTTHIYAQCASSPVITTVAATCVNTCDGSISVILKNSLVPSPYKIEVNNKTYYNSSVISSLCTGTYNLVITNQIGCVPSAPIPVKIYPLTYSAERPSGCDTCKDFKVSYTKANAVATFCNGSAQLSFSGGVGPFKVKWNTGDTTKKIVNLCPGWYHFLVTDQNTKCSWSDSLRINQKDTTCLLIADVEVQTAHCLEICDGKVYLKSQVNTIQPNLGSPALIQSIAQHLADYLAQDTILPNTNKWFVPFTVNNKLFVNYPDSLPILDSLCVGKYQLDIVDFYGCRLNKTVEIKPEKPNCGDTCALEVKISKTGTDKGCKYQLTANPTGGNGVYSYLWNPGMETTKTISNICSGNISVLVTDDSSHCTASDSVQLTHGDPKCNFSIVTLVHKDATKTTNCDGIAEVSTLGGSGNFTYLWDNNSTNAIANNLCPGLHWVKVIDNVGCYQTDTIRIALDTSSCGLPMDYEFKKSKCSTPTGFIKIFPSKGFGSYTITVTRSSGPNYGYSGTWTLNQNTDTIRINNLWGNWYSIKVVDNATGCKGRLLIDLGHDTLDCYGEAECPYSLRVTNGQSCKDSCNGWVKLQYISNGNVLPANANWKTSDGRQEVGSMIMNLCGGISYSYETTDALCHYRGSGVISINQACQNCNLRTSASYTTPNANSCNGTATVNVTGGSGNYSYRWNDPNQQTTATATNLCSRFYYIDVVDNVSGCKAVDSVEIPVGIIPGTCQLQANATVIQGTPNSGTCVGEAEVQGFNGSGQYQYQWDNGNTNSYATDLCFGQHIATTKDLVSGCTTTDTIFIPHDTKQNCLSFEYKIHNSGCDRTGDGKVEIDVNWGVGPFQYSIKKINGNYSDSQILTSGKHTFSNLSSGDYWLKVDQTNQECYGWAKITIGLANGPNCNSPTPCNQIPKILLWAATCKDSCDGRGIAYLYEEDGYSKSTHNTIWQYNGKVFAGDMVTDFCPGNYKVTISTSNCEYKFEGKMGFKSDSCTGLCDLSADKFVKAAGLNCSGTGEVLPKNGSGNYTYLWNDPAQTTNAKAINLCAGTYQAKIRDIISGCEIEESVEIPILKDTICNPNLTITTSVQNTTSATACDGSASVTVDGGNGNYDFQWSNTPPSTSSSASNLCNRAYTVTVADKVSGCDTTITAIIGPRVSCDLNVSVEKHNETGINRCDGSASVTVSGGSGNFSYLWSNNSTSNTVTGLCSGNYTVKVTDNNRNCDTTLNVVIVVEANETNCLQLTFNSSEPTCASICDGSISVAVTGGSGNYVYSWSTGDYGNNVDRIESLCDETTYRLTVIDADKVGAVEGTSNPCYFVTDSVTFGMVSSLCNSTCSNGEETKDCCPLTINIVGNRASCPTSKDGELNVGASGGIPPYQYKWNNGSGNTSQWVTTGYYTVVVTDASGNTISAGLSVGYKAETCDGVSTEDYEQIFASTGVPYTSVSVESAAVVPCDDRLNLTVIQPSCVSASDGIMEVNYGVYGGGSSVYLWNDGVREQYRDSVLAGVYNGTAVYPTKKCTGKYNVDLTPGCKIGCDSLLGFCNLNVSVEKHNETGINRCDGSASVTVSGGSGNFSYLWSNNSTSNTVTGLCSGNYTVKVTDNNRNCDTTLNVVIVVEANETNCLQLTFNSSEPTCASICDGSINVAVTGGSGNYVYSWSTGDYGNNVDRIESLCDETTYRLTVIDADKVGTVKGTSNQCYFVTDSVTFGMVSSLCNSTCSNGEETKDCCPLTINIRSISASCATSKDGMLYVGASGGIPPYQYKWSNGSGNTTQQVTTGYYTVVVTDASGNTIGAGLSVGYKYEACANVPPDEDYGQIFAATGVPYGGVSFTAAAVPCDDRLDLSVVQPSCVSASDGIMMVNYNINGGNTPAYLWNDGSRENSRDSVLAGVYNGTAIVQDKKCTGKYNVDLTPGCKIGCDSLLGVCNLNVNVEKHNETGVNRCDGSALVTVSGGSGNFSYQWSNNSISNTVTGLCSGNYTVKVTDESRNCDTTIAVVIVIEPNETNCLQLTFDSREPTCASICDGSISVAVTGGSGNYVYSWSTGDYGNNVDRIESLCDETTYRLTVVDADKVTTVEGASNTCYVVTDSVTFGRVSLLCDSTCSNDNVTKNCCPLFMQMVSQSASCQTSKDGALRVGAGGGIPPYQYRWSNGSGNKRQWVTSGYYTVVVTDASGNTISAGISMGYKSIYCKDTIDATPKTTDGCDYDMVLSARQPSCLSAMDGEMFVDYIPYDDGEVSFLWTDGSTENTRDSVLSGSYNGTAIDSSNGCTGRYEVNLTPACKTTCCDGFTIKSRIREVCEDNCSGIAYVRAFGGVEPYVYVWEDGTSNDSISNLCPGWYSVTVFDATGCQRNDSVEMVVGAPMEINLDINNAQCDGVCNGEIIIQPIGGYEPYSYFVNENLTGDTATNLCHDSARVRVVDTRGCSASAAGYVGVDKVLDFTTQAVNSVCANPCGGMLILSNVQNASTPYIFSASLSSPPNNVQAPSGEDTIKGLCPESYVPKLVDADGCYSNGSSIVVGPSNYKSTVGSVRATCPDICDGLAFVRTTYPGEVTYSWFNGSENDTVSDLCPGSYQVVVHSTEYGCIDTLIATVTSKLSSCCDVVKVNGDFVICQREQVQLIASGGKKYKWSPSDGLSNPYIANPIASPASTTEYSVAVESEHCSYIVHRKATVVVSRPLEVKGYADTTLCQTANVNLGLIMNETDDALVRRIRWSPVAGLNCTSCENPVATVNQSKTYTITVYDSLNCPYSDQVSIVLNSGTSGVKKSNYTTCAGNEVILQAYGGVKYCWSQSTTACIGTNASLVVYPNSSSVYRVQITNELGCVSTQQVVVSVMDTPDLELSVVEIDCVGNAKLKATGMDSYEWTPEDGLSCAKCDKPDATITESPFTYTVTGIKSDCFVSKDLTVNFNVFGELSFSAAPQGCGFNFEVNNGSPNMTYRWNFGDNKVGSGPAVYHRYENSGTFIVKLIVNDSSCGTYTIEKTIHQTISGCDCNE